MKQTAVEFISKGLFDILQEAEDNNIFEVGTQNFKRYIEMFLDQAKEMEKQQHKETWFESASQFAHESEMLYKKDFEQYYNETFNPTTPWYDEDQTTKRMNVVAQNGNDGEHYNK
jgi:hypothetical protein